MQIGRSAFAAQFIPGPPDTFRRSPFGSKLSIYTLSDGLSLIDLVKTCLLYLRGVKVKIKVFANRPKCICGAIYSRAPLHIQKVSFWFKALYPYSIRRFESHRPSGHLPFLPPSLQSQNSSFCKSAEVHLRRNLFPGPLTHSEGLLLAQSSLSIHYPTV